MTVTTTKISVKDTEFLRVILSNYIDSTNHLPDRSKNTQARILHNIFFDLENKNVTSIELSE